MNKKIENLAVNYKKIIELVGEKTSREGLKKTPERCNDDDSLPSCADYADYFSKTWLKFVQSSDQ